ncbi:caspase family protein [Leptothermofonsia sp. ETS-13]|uniref:nSTAND1 domain-containing NTPase n=1 Tax=Leptothermofonsia sp. ETS-13 TaxID=3035696 RepID=UPI003BA13919
MSRDALVVGISAYQWLPNLSAPAQDAEAIAQRLQSSGDFRVTRMPDIIQRGQSRIGSKTPVTLAELETALVRLFKPKGNNIPHTALFYFSGHGLQKDAGIQEGYLATSDANPNVGFYGLSLFWLRRLLQESPVKQRIILLDCCHSGELLNFLEADPGARSGTDRLFMAASREYEAAYESIEGTYSIFTRALLDGLDPTRVPNGVVTNYALTDWVSNALKGEMQQPLFENSGSEIILTCNQGASTIIKTELAQEICPYRGLECFDEAHAEYFFGREDLTDQLIEKLKTRNFVAVVGASGSGKSSLVRAGLIHQLRQGHKFSGSDRWRIQLITPTEQPLRSLASAFVNSQAPTVDRAEHLRRAEALLREGGNGLSHLVRASLISSKYGRNSRLLLIIDQFEEVFTLCQGPQAERDRHRFFNSLLTALQEASDCLNIVIVLRADFFGKCSLYNGLAEQIEQNLITVTPLTYEQIKASVVKPAQKVGVVCDPNLVYNILLDVVGAPGELPLLQYTLLELWQQRQPDSAGGPARLTLDAYTELGGVRGTLQKRANAIFYSLTPEEQQVAKRIFIALTQLGDGTEDTRRRILKSELVSPRFPAELVDRVLEKLVAAKLVVTNQIVPTSRYREQTDQGFANVSTALRLAQICQGKFPKHNQPIDLPSARVQTSLEGEHIIAKVTQLPTNHLAERSTSQGLCPLYQETVDVAHETLIRHWLMLRTWLDESREMLRRQRRIEHAAREWHNAEEPRSNEYLLHGARLIDAEDFLKTYPDELSILAQRFISISREENQRTQKELRLLQMVIPCTLLVALAVTFTQYIAAIKSQAEKDYQLQIATSRQQAAIAQSILQEPDGDPMAALLISRLAVEKGRHTYEAQASLRAALQKLRLQANLKGHTGAIQTSAFSPTQPYFATGGEDGTIRLWSLKTQSAEKVWQWEGGPADGKGDETGPPQISSATTNPQSGAIAAIAFSPDGKLLAAIARDSNQVRVWSVETGVLQFQLQSGGGAIIRLAFSPDGQWIATVDSQQAVHLWRVRSGQIHRKLSHPVEVRDLAFSPNGEWLLTASGSKVHIWEVNSGRSHQVLRHRHQVNCTTFSPDGLTIATASSDGSVQFWRAPGSLLQDSYPWQKMVNSKPLHTYSSSLSQVLFSPNGRVIAVADQQNRIWLWEVNTGRLKLQPDRTNDLKSPDHPAQGMVAFSPDSQYLATTGWEISTNQLVHTVQLWNVQSGQLVDILRGYSGALKSIQFSPDGSLIATAGTDGSARLWAAEPGSEFPTLKMMGDRIQWVAFRSPNLQQNFDFSDATTARIKPTATTSTPAGFDDLLTVAANGTIHHWSFPYYSIPGEISKTLSSQSLAKQPVSQSVLREGRFNFFKWVGDSASFLKPKSENYSAGFRFTIWRPQTQETPNRSSKTVQAISLDRTQPPSAVPAAISFIQKLPPGMKLAGAAFNSDTQLMATASYADNVQLWKLQPDGTVNLVRNFDLPDSVSSGHRPTTERTGKSRFGTIRQLVFSPENQKLLGVGDDRVIYLWDVQSGKLTTRLKGHGAAIEQARFSPDGQLVVSASRDRTARIWKASTGELVNTLPHRNAVSSAQFSLDNQLVVTASQDGTARVVDIKTGAMRVLLAGHYGAVFDAEFSPNGLMIVTAGADGTARLWDAQTGTEEAILRPFEENGQPLARVFFSPDGHYVAALGKSGKLYVWVATWEGLLHLARDRSLRQLKPEECLRYLRLPPNACPTLEVKN